QDHAYHWGGCELPGAVPAGLTRHPALNDTLVTLRSLTGRVPAIPPTVLAVRDRRAGPRSRWARWLGCDGTGWTARPTSRGAPGASGGLRGGRRQACTGSAVVVASLERTTTTGHGAACRQSRATGPSGVPAWGAGPAGPAGPRPGRVLPSTSISAPTERSSRTR